MTAEDLLGSARALFHEGDVDGAVKMFLRARAFEEAAACLARHNRYKEGGQLLMDALGVPPSMVGGLGLEQKRMATRAAQLLALAGDVDTSTKLYLALGDVDRAAAVYEHAGDTVNAARLRTGVQRRMSGQVAITGPSVSMPPSAGVPSNRAEAIRFEAGGNSSLALQTYVKLRQYPDAARVAEQMGKHADAAMYYEQAGMPFETARCWLTLGDTAKTLDALTRVPRTDGNYRAACVQAIRIAIDLNAFDFRMDQFIARFVGDGPRTDQELEAFYLLGKLYTQRDFAESAVDVWRKILAVRPGYRDVQAKLDGLESDIGGSTKMQLEAIVRDDAGFSGRSLQRGARDPMADLAPLPDLPDLPPLAVSGGPLKKADPIPPRQGTAPSVGMPISEQAPSIGGGASAANRTAVSQMPESQRRIQAAATTEAPVAAPPISSPVVTVSDEPFSPENLPCGCIIADRYRVESKIGMGGMAAVYKVQDEELGETVAMKVFFGQHDQTLLARFKQEVSLSRQLAHPNIVRLYDLGTHEGYKFLTMELLEGRELRALMTGSPMDLSLGLNYLAQACDGLALAHERGIIHRDLKPENMFVSSKDVLKVMDFGIAKGTRPSGVTVAGYIAGTPTYMAPEQIRDFGSVTHLADLYALGIIAYEIFTGRPPFHHEELMGMLAMHIAETPVPPKEKNPELPDELEDIILRLLEKEPPRRIPSCRDLAAMLREIRPQSRAFRR